MPIYALSPGKETVRRCGLMWGVQAARMRRHEVTEELIADAARRALEEGWVKRGDRIGDHRRAAQRQAGDHEPVPGPAGVAGLRQPGRDGGRSTAERVRLAIAPARGGRGAAPARSPAAAGRAGAVPGEEPARRAPSSTSTAKAAIACGESRLFEVAAERGVGEPARR